MRVGASAALALIDGDNYDGRHSMAKSLNLVVLSATMLAVRLVAAARVGFGDSEALYACYALHPQAAYLDHPGLVGLFARAIGAGGAPSAVRAHVVTALLATAMPWLLALACRAAGATGGAAIGSAIVVALVPEMAIGLFAMTPDLLLALAWTGALALACAGLGAAPGGARATALLVGAGLAAGIAAAAKVTGLALFVALTIAYAARAARPHSRTMAPWAGLAAGALVVAPIAMFEARSGWPMLLHRLVDTQADAGFSLRNAAAFVGGQLAYLSPIVVIVAAIAAADLVRKRERDAVDVLLLAAFVVPLAALVPLCLWSPAAEPHWIAPALLALPVHVARRATPIAPRRLLVAAAAVAGTMVAAVHAWVLVPALVARAPASYDARADISNELFGWPEVVRAVRDVAAEEWVPGTEPHDMVVVGPHWVVCAQLHAALARELVVGCATPVRDDFDAWEPRAAWRRAETLLWVTDARFGDPDPEAAPSHAAKRVRTVEIRRGGRIVRAFAIVVLGRRAQG
jgi:4-amino-4-deoxy-L-arabinose transferase-like glycosyltransferase